MNITEQFQDQLDNVQIVTEDNLERFNNKKFTSGRLINIGDKLLMGLLVGEFDETSIEVGLKIITVHPEELDTIYQLFKFDAEEKNTQIKESKIPILELIKK